MEIRLIRHPIATMRRRKMEAGGQSVKDYATRWMQLHHPLQGTIGNSPSLNRMENIHERKSETSTSLHRPQKLGHLYVNKRTQWPTRKVARIPQPIQFQNHIPTGEGGKEAWRPHQKTRRHTHNGRKETGKKKRNPTTKRKYWDIPEDEDIKLEELELAEFQDKDKGRIQQAYNKDDQIQAIKKNLKKGVKEMKGVAWGC